MSQTYLVCFLFLSIDVALIVNYFPPLNNEKISQISATFFLHKLIVFNKLLFSFSTFNTSFFLFFWVPVDFLYPFQVWRFWNSVCFVRLSTTKLKILSASSLDKVFVDNTSPSGTSLSASLCVHLI